MASVTIPHGRELSREPAAILPPDHELFAVHVASGVSYRESARRAGFHEDNGFRLMKIEAVRARVEELLSGPSERIRAGIEAEFLILRNRVANEDLDEEGRANVDLRLKLLIAHARYHGWIVEKKHVARASVDFGKVTAEHLRAHLAEYLDALDPGVRGEIEARIQRVDARRLRHGAR